MSTFTQKLPAIRAASIALAVSSVLTSTTVFAQNTYTGAPVLSAGSIGENAMDATFTQLREAARANNASKATKR